MPRAHNLTTPLLYLKISHPLTNRINIFSVIIPIAPAFLLGWYLPHMDFFGNPGIISGFNSLLQIMIGFFVTSLSVVANFKGEYYHIDEPFAGDPAKLNGKILTRRQFLAHMFAYLVCLCFLLYLSGVVAMAIAVSIHGIDIGLYRKLFRSIFLIIYSVGVCNVIGTTLIGITFLSGRMTRNSPDLSLDAEIKPEFHESP